MKKFLLIICLGLQSLGSFAQEEKTEKPVYFEAAPQGLVRFFFDNYYFLVDKDCAFKSIERVTQFIVSKNVFHGEFRDFAPNGKVILTGSYEEGLKQGDFKAFHPNGNLKWEVTFQNNIPQGFWNYYYPDGKPMLSVNYGTDYTRITSFWDQKGRQRVVEGNGTYEFKMPFDFYNEYGYPFFERKGKLREGLPSGYWTTHVVDNKGRKELMAEEFYNNRGILQEGYNLFEDEEYNYPMQVIPYQYFFTAESLTFKQCNFDDFSGFNSYIADFLEKAFVVSPQLSNLQDDFAYNVTLSKDGTPKELTITKRLSNVGLNPVLEQVVKAIPFYFPSMNIEGEPIEDKLQVSGKLVVDVEGKFDFHSIHIERENQP